MMGFTNISLTSAISHNKNTWCHF